MIYSIKIVLWRDVFVEIIKIISEFAKSQNATGQKKFKIV